MARLLADLVVFVVSPWALAQDAPRLEWPRAGSHCYCGQLATRDGPAPVVVTLTLPVRGDEAIVGELHCPRLGLDLVLHGKGIGEAGEVTLVGGAGDVADCRLEGKFDAVARTFPCALSRPGVDKALRLGLELVAVERVHALRQPLAVEWEQHAMVFDATQALARAVNEAQLAMPGNVEKALAPGLGMEPTMHEDGSGHVDTHPGSAMQFTGSERWVVWHRGPRLISMAGMGEDYAGGAHGSYWLDGMTFVDRGGKIVRLGLADLAERADADTGPRLAALLRERLHAQGASDAERLELPKLDGSTGPAFAVDSDGILFGFSPYAVGCYAEGCYVVRLSWREMRGVLKPPAELDGVDAAASAPPSGR